MVFPLQLISYHDLLSIIYIYLSYPSIYCLYPILLFISLATSLPIIHFTVQYPSPVLRFIVYLIVNPCLTYIEYKS